MKQQIITILIFVMLASAVVWATNYNGRMKQVNKYQCAAIGKMEDCKTPLPESGRLK